MKIKSILAKIGWNENQIPIKFRKNIRGSIFLPRNKILINLKDHDKNRIYHEILHECLHHLIESENNYRIDYLREYRVEKMLRKICKKYNLNNILEKSQDWIDYMLKINPVYESAKPYVYAAKRISREEKK